MSANPSVVGTRQSSSDHSGRPSDQSVRLKYEPEYDLLSIWLGAPQPVDQVEVEPGVYVRVSRASHAPVGLEVIEALARLQTDSTAMAPPDRGALVRILTVVPMALVAAWCVAVVLGTLGFPTINFEP